MIRVACLLFLLFHTTLAREEGFSCAWPFVPTWNHSDVYDPATQPTEWFHWWAGYNEANAILNARYE